MEVIWDWRASSWMSASGDPLAAQVPLDRPAVLDEHDRLALGQQPQPLKRNAAQLTATESRAIVEITISVPVTDSSLWVMPC